MIWTRFQVQQFSVRSQRTAFLFRFFIRNNMKKKNIVSSRALAIRRRCFAFDFKLMKCVHT